MAILLPKDTASVLEGKFERVENRSLYMDRYADPSAKEKDRGAWFQQLLKKQDVPPLAIPNWYSKHCHFVYGELKARLMVNMAGGVMENAGLCLDRFGIPYIPGSAIKGCARRVALAALREWCELGKKPSEESDLLTPVCKSFESPGEMLAVVAEVFGWIEDDWKGGRGDFVWACAERRQDVLKEAREFVSDRLGLKRAGSPIDASQMTFAGCIAFLPAYPNKDPGLDLDIVNCHHQRYYQNPTESVAYDTEEPNPVLFPAVNEQEKGYYFRFPIYRLNRGSEDCLETARKWLARGLEIFGIGAKTNAGYGWFDTSHDVQERVITQLENKRREDEERRRLQEEREREARIKAEEYRIRRERQAALEGLDGDQLEDKKLELLTEAQVEAKLANFLKAKGGPTDEEKRAIVRALREARISTWEKFKQKARKGKLATVEQEIRKICKEMGLGKMP